MLYLHVKQRKPRPKRTGIILYPPAMKLVSSKPSSAKGKLIAIGAGALSQMAIRSREHSTAKTRRAITHIYASNTEVRKMNILSMRTFPCLLADVWTVCTRLVKCLGH